MNQYRTAAVLAALFVGACGAPANEETSFEAAVESANETADQTVAANDAPVAFELNDMQGQSRSSAEWDGQPKLINFWATWCAPCRREIPLLKASQDRYTNIDLQVVGIAVDFLDDVVAYAEEAEFNYPILVGQEDAMAVAESSGVEFIGLPFTMVVAPSGELLKTHVGEIEEEHIESIATVFAAMADGVLDVAGAREQLRNL